MTLDVSLEAIEADLAIADRGGQVATIALARAQVRATLLATQPVDHQGRHEAPTPTVTMTAVGADEDGVPDIVVAQGDAVDFFTVPHSAPWDDRVTAAAMLLGLDLEGFQLALGGYQSPEERRGDALPLEPPAGPIEDDDVEDVFAEARKARKR